MKRLTKLDGDERGATAVEYAILVAFIAAIVGVGILAFGGAVLAFYETVIQPAVDGGLMVG